MQVGEIVAVVAAIGGLVGGGGLGGYLLSRQKNNQDFTLDVYKNLFELVKQLQEERDACREQSEVERARRKQAEALLREHGLELPK
jgi:hypothetical protein